MVIAKVPAGSPADVPDQNMLEFQALNAKRADLSADPSKL
jgi:hypothetical protein